MTAITKSLYHFLFACRGNWRSSIYISTGSPGYLLSANRDGQPIVMPVEQFQQLSGEIIDPGECCGQLIDEGFRALYAQYLLCVCRQQKMIRCAFSAKAARKWTGGECCVSVPQ